MRFVLAFLLLGLFAAPANTCEESTCQTKERPAVVRRVVVAPVRALIRVRHNRKAVRLCRRESRRETVATSSAATSSATSAPATTAPATSAPATTSAK